MVLHHGVEGAVEVDELLCRERSVVQLSQSQDWREVSGQVVSVPGLEKHKQLQRQQTPRADGEGPWLEGWRQTQNNQHLQTRANKS